MPFSCCERLDDGLLIFVGDRLVMLIKGTSLFARISVDSLPWTPICAGIHWSVTPTRSFSWDRILVSLFSNFFGVLESIKY